MRWGTLISEWREWLKAAGRPPSTVKLRCYQMRRFAEVHPLGVDTKRIIRWIAESGWAPATMKSYRSALVTFYGWAHARGYVARNPTRDLPSIRCQPGTPRPAPEPALSEALTKADRRMRLMLCLAAYHGLRAGEIAQIHTDDLIPSPDGCSLTVHGKGAKDRVVPLLPRIADELLEATPGFLFPSPYGDHLTANCVSKLISEALPGQWTAHTLRHRFATRAYAGTHDILAVQQLLGHSRPETTRGYVLTPQDDLRAALRAAA